MWHTTTANASGMVTSGRPMPGTGMQDPAQWTGPPSGTIPAINYVTNSPNSRAQSQTLMTIAPQQNRALRDWEGFARQAELHQLEARSPARSVVYVPPMVKREGSPSVGVLREATERGNANYAEWMKRYEGLPPDHAGGILPPESPYNPRGAPSAISGQPPVLDRPVALLDHQGFLAWKRDEYRRRLEAESRGEVYTPRSVGGGKENYLMMHGDVSRSAAPGERSSGLVSIDFAGRQRNLPVQVLATQDELAWLEPPPIPMPIGWNGHWDLCAGHELILQHMAVSGATPQNSPSLTEHFMYPELISCFQRLLVGTYLIRYHSGYEPPHERFFYIKSLPLANRAQYAPFLCWSLHRNSHNALDAIPLCNVMWVTQGMHSPNFRRYYIGGHCIQGPFVGKNKVECLDYGCFSVWYFDGQNTRGLDILATDPLVFTIWMKLLEDVAQLNAALDTTGRVRRMQRYIESLREEGALSQRGLEEDKKKSWAERLYG